MLKQDALKSIAQNLARVAELGQALIENRELMTLKEIGQAEEDAESVVEERDGDKRDARGEALRKFRAEGGLI